MDLSHKTQTQLDRIRGQIGSFMTADVGETFSSKTNPVEVAERDDKKLSFAPLPKARPHPETSERQHREWMDETEKVMDELYKYRKKQAHITKSMVVYRNKIAKLLKKKKLKSKKTPNHHTPETETETEKTNWWWKVIFGLMAAIIGVVFAFLTDKPLKQTGKNTEYLLNDHDIHNISLYNR